MMWGGSIGGICEQDQAEGDLGRHERQSRCLGAHPQLPGTVQTLVLIQNQPVFSPAMAAVEGAAVVEHQHLVRVHGIDGNGA